MPLENTSNRQKTAGVHGPVYEMGLVVTPSNGRLPRRLASTWFNDRGKKIYPYGKIKLWNTCPIILEQQLELPPS